MSDSNSNRSRLLKKLPKLRERISQHGFPSLKTIDPSFVPDALNPLILYAEILAFDWVKKGFEKFLASAPDELFEELRGFDRALRSNLADYVKSIYREPTKQLEHLSVADIQRLHDRYYSKGWRYQSAWLLEPQSAEHHAWSNVQDALLAAKFHKTMVS